MTFRKLLAIVCIPIICLIPLDYLTAQRTDHEDVIIENVSPESYSKNGRYVMATAILPTGNKKTFKIKTNNQKPPIAGYFYNFKYKQGLLYKWSVKITPSKNSKT